MTSHLSCGVMFDADPIWLWSIRPNSWSKIYITGPDEFRLCQDHPILFKKLEPKCSIISSTFARDYPTICPDVMWISGSKCFIDQVILPPSGTHVYLLVKASRRCPLDLTHIQWTKVSHHNIGGVTNACGTFGIDSRSNPIRMERDLNRSLGNVLTYSIRPKAFDPIPS